MNKLLSVGCVALSLGVVLSACSVNDTAGINRVTDKNPDIKVNKLVSPTQDRTAYAKQLLASNQLPDVLIAVSPAGFAESGALYEWKQEELSDFIYPKNGAINGKQYQLPANTQTIP